MRYHNSSDIEKICSKINNIMNSGLKEGLKLDEDTQKYIIIEGFKNGIEKLLID